MKNMLNMSFLILMISLLACTNTADNKQEGNTKKEDDVKVTYIKQNDKTFKAIMKHGAALAVKTQVELGKALTKAMTENGPDHALDVCNHEAMQITDSVAQAEGVIIRRIAKKNRNPKNAMNAVESKVFKQYIMEYLQGVDMKPKVSISDDGHPVYYKPIITNSMCLTCHGTPGETMSVDLEKKIKEYYPEDKAINFKEGHPRGLWAITFTKININPQGTSN